MKKTIEEKVCYKCFKAYNPILCQVCLRSEIRKQTIREIKNEINKIVKANTVNGMLNESCFTDDILEMVKYYRPIYLHCRKDCG